jgi:NAD(P)-dependent dehydrogenase (short-subunit alcohol dehydrogenase family)
MMNSDQRTAVTDACATCCAGRVVIVTGADRGLGRSYALELARHGASVVVNDLGTSLDGAAEASSAAEEVVGEIRNAGGLAVSNGDDVASWTGAQTLVQTALDSFGRLDGLINNAGILRDRTLVNLDERDWDDVIRVHLKGAFAPMRWAVAHWRERSKLGDPVDARVINTTSPSGIFGNFGQSNYGAAKAGVASLTVIAAKEVAPYGVTVNAIAPAARTRMTEHLPSGGSLGGLAAEGFDAASPDNVAPLAVWLMSARSKDVTGRVFSAHGGHIDVAEGWRAGPSADRDARWTVADIDEIVPGLVARAQPNADMLGRF